MRTAASYADIPQYFVFGQRAKRHHGWTRLDHDLSADLPVTDPDPELLGSCRQLNTDQRQRFNRFVGAVLDGSPSRNFFSQGAGDTGKTFLHRVVYGHVPASQLSA